MRTQELRGIFSCSEGRASGGAAQRERRERGNRAMSADWESGRASLPARPEVTLWLDEGSFCFLAGFGEVVAIQVHDLIPCGHKVFHELLLRSGAGIDLG